MGRTLGPPHPAQDSLVLGGDRCGVLLGLISHQQCGGGDRGQSLRKGGLPAWGWGGDRQSLYQSCQP